VSSPLTMQYLQASGGGLSLERLLEVAHATGELVLTCRNLKSFPKHRCKNDLKDTVSVDLSRNKLTELPQECTDYFSLERLVLYHNTIRSIPDSIVYLQSLQFLDLSRNQLSYLPISICELPLQALVVNNNRLVSLPEEIGKMSTLMKLDVSCNEITHLPVQIGDLTSLKVLNLRRNHLQEIPIEISYLQLRTLDLSGNRIVSLPVELRFMTSVVNLNLGENPLTCPLANLVSRGKIHVFKYLEIQAIKEDRKRGVLTDGDYRRSYRKTTAQLNDFRFASGFGADARRKRHTADSGYGSEQPLDRRWSQEFNQEVDHHHPSNADDTRRIMMRAAAAQRSPNSRLQAVTVASPAASATSNSNQNNPTEIASTSGPARGRGILNNSLQTSLGGHPPPTSVNPTPLTSTGSTTSSTASSSGYSSITGAETTSGPNISVSGGLGLGNRGVNPAGGSEYACSNSASPNSSTASHTTVPVPSVSSSSTESSKSGTCRIIPIIKEKPTVPQPQSSNGNLGLPKSTSTSNTVDTVDSSNHNKPKTSSCSNGSTGDQPDDYEKEERRRAAQRVLGKQGPQSTTTNVTPGSKLLKSALPSPSASYKQAIMQKTTHSKPSNSMLPLPNALNQNQNNSSNSTSTSNAPSSNVVASSKIYQQHQRENQTHTGPSNPRQFKEQQQLRQRNHEANEQNGGGGHGGGHHYQQPRLTASALARMQQLQGAEPSALPTTTTRSLYDVKAMQKEAVLSYVKAKQSSPSRSVAGRGSQPDLPGTTKNGGLSNGGRAASTTSIPQPSPTGNNTSSIIKSLGKLKMETTASNGHHNAGRSNNSMTSSSNSLHGGHGPVHRRHDVEKSATADAHINQLRLEIETRLRITMPEDISAALADGVILCHVANHVRPRAVPSIHVPSPSVPKLNTAKCRRNVENFLLACRKIGVREDLICSPSDILEPRKQGSVRVAISVSELLRFHYNRS